jgi:hypothetical protein
MIELLPAECIVCGASPCQIRVVEFAINPRTGEKVGDDRVRFYCCVDHARLDEEMNYRTGQQGMGESDG